MHTASAPTSPSHRQVDLILQSLDELPTLSPVAVRLLKLTGAHDADFDEIVRVIETDPALSAKVLSLVRRASVGGSGGSAAARTITTVKRAAVMLGLEALQSAVLSVQIYELLRQAPNGDEQRDGSLNAFDRAGFWKHSIAVGCAAELLAREVTAVRIAPDEAFIAGLLHDLGKLALDWILPKTYDRVIRQATGTPGRAVALHAVERGAIGIDHHQAGKRLAERWSLPHQLQDAMWLHSQPPGAMPDMPHRALVGVVAVANALAHRMLIGWSGGNADSASRAADLWAAELGLKPDRIAGVQERLHEAVAERCQLLGVGEETPASMIVESITKANTRLARLHEQVRIQSKAAAGSARALALITEFASAERPGGTLSDTLGRIAQGWKHLTGKAPMAIVAQTRAPGMGGGNAEPWRFLRCDASGNVTENTALPRPSRPRAIRSTCALSATPGPTATPPSKWVAEPRSETPLRWPSGLPAGSARASPSPSSVRSLSPPRSAPSPCWCMSRSRTTPSARRRSPPSRPSGRGPSALPLSPRAHGASLRTLPRPRASSAKPRPASPRPRPWPVWVSSPAARLTR
ncbi:MAG: HDOD domain-containing protein [Phycisphaerales bacterium]